MSTSTRAFAWPDGRRAAVSFSFDDTRDSQLDAGLPVLERHRVRATFYASLGSLARRAADWSAAVRRGHEIGNHSLTHPCTGNYPFSRSNALEDYDLPRMEQELLEASARIAALAGASPRTFAYPCGETTVGRGVQARSYVPLVAKHFVIGRGVNDSAWNHPLIFDPARAAALLLDGLVPAQIEWLIEQAEADGGWLIFCAHDVGGGPRQTVSPETLDALCRRFTDPPGRWWVDTVAEIGSYIVHNRPAP